MRTVGVWMNAGKNNNKQSDKKDQIDIVTNNQDKNYNSTKHLKELLSVSECPESRIKPCRFKP